MTHTPGPWKLAPDPYRAAPQIIANGRRIAKVYYEGGSEDREVDANACLIAAAPELLKALRRIASSEYRSDRRNRNMVSASIVQDLQRIARLAIANATQEKP